MIDQRREVYLGIAIEILYLYFLYKKVFKLLIYYTARAIDKQKITPRATFLIII